MGCLKIFWVKGREKGGKGHTAPPDRGYINLTKLPNVSFIGNEETPFEKGFMYVHMERHDFVFAVLKKKKNTMVLPHPPESSQIVFFSFAIPSYSEGVPSLWHIRLLSYYLTPTPLRVPLGMKKDPTSGQEGNRFKHFVGNSLKRAVYLVGKIQK